MRRLFTALALALCFALSTAAHADTFQYTIIWDYPHIATSDTTAFLGTYTFTVDSLLTGDTFVYGPGFKDAKFPGYTYVYAADFTVPVASKVSEIEISYFPDYTPFNTLGIKTHYAFSLYQANGGTAVGSSLIQDANDPYKFFASYGDGTGTFVSMQITDLPPSSVPEPSTITFLGLGSLTFGSRVYRRIVRK